MPRNSSGTYSLPAGNPVVPNTLIESNWANPTMADLGAAVTDSLDRYGRGGMLAQLKLADGTAAQPAFAFNAESSTGLFRPSAGSVALSVLGAVITTYAAGSVLFNVPPAYAADPVSANQLTRKSYVDGAIASIGGGLFLPLTGGTLTGPGNLTVLGSIHSAGPFFANGAPNNNILYSGISLAVSGGAPSIYMLNKDGGADAKLWDVLVQSNRMLFRTINDALTVGVPWMDVSRVGNAVPSVVFPGANIGIGGATPYGGRLSIMPAVNPASFAAANQICIGEASGNAGYRLQLGYATTGGFWQGSIQTYEANAPANLVLNGVGGDVSIGATGGSRLAIAVNTTAADGWRVINTSGGGYSTFGVNGAAGALPAWANSTVLEAVPVGAGGLFLSTYSGDIVFQTNARTERLRIPANGAISINGTSEPGAVLTVRGPVVSVQGPGTDGFLDYLVSTVAHVVMGFNDTGAANGSAVPSKNAYVGSLNNFPVCLIAGTVRAVVGTDGSFTTAGVVNTVAVKTNRIWQNVTVSRNFNTDYVAPAYDMEVSSTNTTSANNQTLELVVAGVSVASVGNAGATSSWLSLQGYTIPANATYRINATGSITKGSWTELR
jgi:hypothetical protein